MFRMTSNKLPISSSLLCHQAAQRSAATLCIKGAALTLLRQDRSEHHVQKKPSDLTERLHHDGKHYHPSDGDVRKGIPRDVWPHENHRKREAYAEDRLHDHEAAKHRAVEIIIVAPHVAKVALRASIEEAYLRLGQNWPFATIGTAQSHAITGELQETTKRYRP